MSEIYGAKETAEFLKAHDNFLIISHANPDGDTLGCAFALCGALRLMGKKAENICADTISQRFAFMKNAKPPQESFEPQTFITVDVADRKLMGSNNEKYGDKIDLAIDHHVSHVDFAKRLYCEPNAAAAAQPVYKVIKELGVQITNEIAACLYVAITTDSGCFKFSCVSPETHLIAAELLRYDFDFAHLNYIFFDLKTKARIELEEKIYRDIEFYCDGKCAVVSLTAEQMQAVDIEDGNGVSTIPRQIEGVEVGVVFKQRGNGWKASLRSNSNVDVQQICSVFGGGGHAKAAGCSFNNMSLEDAKKQLIAEIGKVFE